MRFVSAISDSESTANAAAEVVATAKAEFDAADAVFVFLTTHHRSEAGDLLEHIQSELEPQVLVGCSAEGVIGGTREIERAPGVALLAGWMPGVRLNAFHIATDDWQEVLGDGDVMRDHIGAGPQTRAIIAFGDPFTTPMNQFLPMIDRIAPSAPLVGGMASSGRRPGENALLLDGELYETGVVGVSLSDGIDVQTVVSQGARPIGLPMVITRAKDNVIQQLGGKPPLLVLREMIQSLPEHEKEMLAHGLMIGRAISEYRERFQRGDFLIRNIIGVDEKDGSIGVGDFVKVGQTVQFHVRDADTADEDLSSMLSITQADLPPAAAALLFSCNGRGARLFNCPNHDIAVASERMPRTPVAGFFAAGEIGPVGGRNFIHGHTASFALLRSAAGM
jgi:small ligand-binding sensory domain FIST